MYFLQNKTCLNQILENWKWNLFVCKTFFQLFLWGILRKTKHYLWLSDNLCWVQVIACVLLCWKKSRTSGCNLADAGTLHSVAFVERANWQLVGPIRCAVDFICKFGSSFQQISSRTFKQSLESNICYSLSGKGRVMSMIWPYNPKVWSWLLLQTHSYFINIGFLVSYLHLGRCLTFKENVRASPLTLTGIWPLILVQMLCNSEDRVSCHLQYWEHLWQRHVWTEIQLMMLILTLLPMNTKQK